MNFLSLILGLLILGTTSVYGARHCKSERNRSYAEQLTRLEPKFDLRLIDLDLFPGGSVVAGYEYDVEPAYTKGLYSRTDRWLVSTKAVPVKDINLSEGFDLALSAGLNHQTEATFTRFFSDPCSAMLSNPYSPRRIPLKAKVALGPKFNTGDYFLFRGSVGFVASAEILSMLGSSLWGVGLSGSYLMEGFYQLHIVRLDDKHIRLKIVAHRGKNISASLGLGYEQEFDVFKINSLNNQLEKFVNTKPIKITANHGQTKVFMVDYVLDLTNPDVVHAYESVLRKVKDFKSINIAGPFKKQKDLEANLLLDLSPLEDLYRQDYQNNQIGRLKRNLRTTSEQNSFGFGLHAGNKILGFKLEKGVSTARMSISLPDDTKERYLLKSWDRNWEGRFFYSWSRSTKVEGLRALFLADETFEKLAPVNIVKHMKHKKNRFTFRNFTKLKMSLKKSLPKEIYAGIPWQNWTQKPKQKFSNYGLRYELLMSPESILEAPAMSAEEIKVLFRDHVKSKGLTTEDFFSEPATNDDNSPTSEEAFELSLHFMAKLLMKALDQNIPAVERLELITKLRKNELFSETGISFIMSLRPDKMKQWYHLDLDISSNESIIDYTYGDGELSILYKKILTIKAALDDDALDLLREAESLSVPVVKL